MRVWLIMGIVINIFNTICSIFQLFSDRWLLMLNENPYRVYFALFVTKIPNESKIRATPSGNLKLNFFHGRMFFLCPSVQRNHFRRAKKCWYSASAFLFISIEAESIFSSWYWNAGKKRYPRYFLEHKRPPEKDSPPRSRAKKRIVRRERNIPSKFNINENEMNFMMTFFLIAPNWPAVQVGEVLSTFLKDKNSQLSFLFGHQPPKN